MTPADRKIAMEWFAREYPRSNQHVEEDGPKSSWWQQREHSLSDFTAGLVAGREWAAKLTADRAGEWFFRSAVGTGQERASERLEGMVRGAEICEAEIRKGPQ